MRKFLALMLVFVAATILSLAEDSNELIPRRGRGIAPRNARGDGPWVTRIMLATSTNGLDFKRRQFVLADQVGAPNVIVDPQRSARIYYVDFGNGNLLACATQTRSDSLTNWTYRRVNISGLSQEHRNNPLDPAVVLLADGRYRLYFTHASPIPIVYSAVSTNGFDFVKEAGARFGEAEAVRDPVLLRTTRQWLLWAGPDGRFTADSTDGLNFRSHGEFRVDGAKFMPWSAAALPNGAGYRLYGNFLGAGEWSGGVSSVFSTNAINWSREPGIRLSLGGSRYPLESRIFPDNGCAQLPDGTWLMAYLATIPVPR